MLLQAPYLQLFLVQLLLHLSVTTRLHRGSPRKYLANLTENRLVTKFGCLYKIISLVNRVHEDRVKFMLFLTKLDSVVNGIFDLADHVLGSLELKVFQAHLDRVQSIHRLIVSQELISLIYCNHKIGVTAHILHLLEEIEALLHHLAIHLDASLFSGLGAGSLLSRRSRSCPHHASFSDLTCPPMNRPVVRLGLGSTPCPNSTITSVAVFDRDNTLLPRQLSIHAFTVSSNITTIKSARGQLCLGSLCFAESFRSFGRDCLFSFNFGLAVSLLLLLDLLLSEQISLVALFLLGLHALLDLLLFLFL